MMAAIMHWVELEEAIGSPQVRCSDLGEHKACQDEVGRWGVVQVFWHQSVVVGQLQLRCEDFAVPQDFDHSLHTSKAALATPGRTLEHTDTLLEVERYLV